MLRVDERKQLNHKYDHIWLYTSLMDNYQLFESFDSKPWNGVQKTMVGFLNWCCLLSSWLANATEASILLVECATERTSIENLLWTKLNDDENRIALKSKVGRIQSKWTVQRCQSGRSESITVYTLEKFELFFDQPVWYMTAHFHSIGPSSSASSDRPLWS